MIIRFGELDENPMKILNSREVKKIQHNLIEQFGTKLEGEYAFFQNKKNKVFICTKDLAKIDFDRLRIERFGLYLGEISDEFRLSKEGAALFVTAAAKKGNKVETIAISKEELIDYFRGNDLDKELGENRFVILDYEGNVIGCAKYKEGKILNFLPKIHRGTVIV